MTAIELANNFADSLDRHTLFEQLAQVLETRIVSGELKPGHRMPSEGALATQYGVSRPVVREALAKLRERGLIETLNGNGTFVRHPNDDDLHEVILRHLRLIGPYHDAVRDLYEARIAVEVMTAQLAATRATDEQLLEIEGHLDRMRANEDAEKDWVSADLAFHEAMAEASHNPFLVMLLKPLILLIEDTIRAGHRSPEAVAGGLSAHARILDALKLHKPDAAAVAIREHLCDSERPVLELLGEREIPAGTDD
jgi:DNA-binding FadR family transcriptional regulator